MRMLSPLTVVPMSSLFDEVDRLMDTFSTPPNFSGGFRTTSDRSPEFSPEFASDFSEDEAQFILCFDMPGVKRADIKVETRGQHLSISSERRRAHKSGPAAVEKFERTFTLPTSVDKDKIEVQYEDGVLSLLLPKAEAAKPRTLEVQSGSKEGGFLSRLLDSKAKAEPKTVN